MIEDNSQTEKKRYKGEATASQADIDAVGGIKDLAVENILFQSDIDAQGIADDLLARLKDKKEYFESDLEYCPLPIERRDTIGIEERVTHAKDVWHKGLVRGIKLSVTPQSQTLTLVLEEEAI